MVQKSNKSFSRKDKKKIYLKIIKEIIKEHFSELNDVGLQIDKFLKMSSKINTDPHHIPKNSRKWREKIPCKELGQRDIRFSTLTLETSR